MSSKRKKADPNRLVIGLIYAGFLIVFFSLGKSIVDLATDSPSTIDLASDDQIIEGFLPVYIVEDAVANPDVVAVGLSDPAVTAQAFPTQSADGSQPAAARDPGKAPDRIEIPSIALEAVIVPVNFVEFEFEGEKYQQWLAPETRAVGWHSTSVGLGVAGNTVLNGHHNIKGQVFRDLYQVQVGQQINLYSEGELFSYVIVYTDILPERNQPLEVRLANAEWIEPTEDERITLITCWPYESNTHRVVVVAVPLRNSGAGSG
ncbi:MAG: sortase [Chloroflexi bacterium]|nr:sortase [Chloroflexota bacterium]MQC25947.1 sortase [Chloroflexota bacterium]